MSYIPTEEDLRNMLERQLLHLIAKAAVYGYVITIETVPRPDEPLAMGNYRMVGHIRPDAMMRKAQAEKERMRAVRAEIHAKPA